MKETKKFFKDYYLGVLGFVCSIAGSILLIRKNTNKTAPGETLGLFMF